VRTRHHRCAPGMPGRRSALRSAICGGLRTARFQVQTQRCRRIPVVEAAPTGAAQAVGRRRNRPRARRSRQSFVPRSRERNLFAPVSCPNPAPRRRRRRQPVRRTSCIRLAVATSI
jgi:hypothetical protein